MRFAALDFEPFLRREKRPIDMKSRLSFAHCLRDDTRTAASDPREVFGRYHHLCLRKVAAVPSNTDHNTAIPDAINADTRFEAIEFADAVRSFGSSLRPVHSRTSERDSFQFFIVSNTSAGKANPSHQDPSAK